MKDRVKNQPGSPVEHPDVAEIRNILELARRAPSVHNTQPWRWRIDGRLLQLRADRSRQLRVADPLGRNFMISCGCALHHAVVGAGALGWRASVDLLPERAEPDVVARLHLVPVGCRTTAATCSAASRKDEPTVVGSPTGRSHPSASTTSLRTPVDGAHRWSR